MFLLKQTIFITNLLPSFYQPKLVDTLIHASESILKVLGPMP
jgi:hypothetical protein